MMNNDPIDDIIEQILRNRTRKESRGSTLFEEMSKGTDIDQFMTKMLSDVILKHSNIDKQVQRDRTNESYEEIKKLDCDVFHPLFYLELFASASQAEAKATMNTMLGQMTIKQLQLTVYVHANVTYQISQFMMKKIKEKKPNEITEEDMKKADELIIKVKEQIMKVLTAMEKDMKKNKPTGQNNE